MAASASMLVRSVDVGTVNFALCDFCPEDSKILRWEVLNVPTIHSLFAAMDARPFDGQVVIERQSKKSMKMTAVQNWLQAYYVLKGLRVTIFSAKHKLKGTGQENSGQTMYRNRKKASVNLITAWLQSHPQDPAIHAWFSSTKKKDDACDSALQAFAFARVPVAAGDLEVEPAKVVCRVPTTHQRQTGRFSQSNLKHIIVKDWQCKCDEDFQARLAADKQVAKAAQRHYGTAERCWQALGAKGMG